jgi:hypothetical protein
MNVSLTTQSEDAMKRPLGTLAGMHAPGSRREAGSLFS